jgi:aldose 1-epimerase
MSLVLPAGQQFEINFGGQRASLVEVGGALRQYEVDGRPLLDGYTAQEFCTGARGQTLAPWPNRLKDGAYVFRGISQQAPLNEAVKRNAIHGLVRWENWMPLERAPHRISLGYTLHAVPGYRFGLQLTNTYELSAAGLSVKSGATNVGSSPCPYATGAHPYLNVGRTLDETRLRAPGRLWMPTDDRGIPTGLKSVEGTPYDFREGASLRGLKVDFAFTDLIRDANGLAWTELANQERTRAVSLWVDRSYPYVELFTGDTLDETQYRRTGLGVEPMTAPPNAFQTGQDVAVLEPGQTMESSWGLKPGPTG